MGHKIQKSLDNSKMWWLKKIKSTVLIHFFEVKRRVAWFQYGMRNVEAKFLILTQILRGFLVQHAHLLHRLLPANRPVNSRRAFRVTGLIRFCAPRNGENFKKRNDEFVTRHRCVKDLLVGFEAKARVSDCTKSSLPYWSSLTLTQNDFSLSFGGAICRERRKKVRKKKRKKKKSVNKLSLPPLPKSNSLTEKNNPNLNNSSKPIKAKQNFCPVGQRAHNFQCNNDWVWYGVVFGGRKKKFRKPCVKLHTSAQWLIDWLIDWLVR